MNDPKKAKTVLFWKEKAAHTEGSNVGESQEWRDYLSGLCQWEEARFSTVQGFPCPCQGRNFAGSGYRIPRAFQLHANSLLPKKRSKNHPLTKQQRKENHQISGKRIFVEHAIRFVKRFRILSERYRNRRNRFALRFSLIAGVCNFDRST